MSIFCKSRKEFHMFAQSCNNPHALHLLFIDVHSLKSPEIIAFPIIILIVCGFHFIKEIPQVCDAACVYMVRIYFHTKSDKDQFFKRYRRKKHQNQISMLFLTFCAFHFKIMVTFLTNTTRNM